jgi:hypothetical protein
MAYDRIWIQDPPGENLDMVLVNRLLRFYDPYVALGLDAEGVVRDLRKHPSRKTPIRWSGERLVSRRQHVARIRFFVENPDRIDAIALDNAVRGGWFCEPIVVDGHHRLIAALILRRRRIPASYSGLNSTLDYLVGKIRREPIF